MPNLDIQEDGDFHRRFIFIGDFLFRVKGNTTTVRPGIYCITEKISENISIGGPLEKKKKNKQKNNWSHFS